MATLRNVEGDWKKNNYVETFKEWDIKGLWLGVWEEDEKEK